MRLCCLLALSLGLWFLCGTSAAADAPPATPGPTPKAKLKAGEKAPDFSLRDREGNLVRLSDFVFPGQETARKKKTKVVLDFVATDCKACVTELPQVVDYQNKHKGEVQVILVAIPEKENGQAKLDEFLKSHPVPFPVLVDGYETVAKKYVADGNTLTLPALFAIGTCQTIKAVFLGLEKDLESALQAAWQKTPAAK
jgi:peroxiredoxin